MNLIYFNCPALVCVGYLTSPTCLWVEEPQNHGCAKMEPHIFLEFVPVFKHLYNLFLCEDADYGPVCFIGRFAGIWAVMGHGGHERQIKHTPHGSCPIASAILSNGRINYRYCLHCPPNPNLLTLWSKGDPHEARHHNVSNVFLLSELNTHEICCIYVRLNNTKFRLSWFLPIVSATPVQWQDQLPLLFARTPKP